MKRIIISTLALLSITASVLAQSPQGAQQGQRPQQGGNIPGQGPRFVQTPDPEYVALSKRGGFGASLPEGRSSNNAPTFFIYPDTRVTEQQAKDLVASLGMDDVLSAFRASYYVINPVGQKYDSARDSEAFIEMFNRARSGNLKVIGIGNGATFVNTAIAPVSAGYIAGILTIDGKPAKFKGNSAGVPAYVAGGTASKVAPEYVAINSAIRTSSQGGTDIYTNTSEPLLTVAVRQSQDDLGTIFNDAWNTVLKKAYRYNNYRHTHYEGGEYGKYGVYELEPFTIWEGLDIERIIVEQPQRSGDPWLWYEYWPKELMQGAEEKSVPVVVLLHGNANDPRTQAETSGFIEVAGKERFLVVEMEWQGRDGYAPMGHDGIETVINTLLAKYPQLDPSRVYAEGLSAGSMTATALGIKKSHVFAAVGGHSGGVFGNPVTSDVSSAGPLYAEATQKRGAVEMPYCSVLGTADTTVPFFTHDNYKGNSYLNAWNVYEQMNGLPVISDLDFSIDPTFGFQLTDRQTIRTNKGEGISIEFGQLYKGTRPLIRFVVVNDYGHWNFKPTAQLMWDFFKQFSRDPQTKKLIYHGE